MQMRFAFTWAFIALFSYVVSAQDVPKKISGVINDMHNKPLPGASVALQPFNDSIVLKQTGANDKGKFEFKNLHSGIYRLVVTNVGYNKYISGSLTIDEQHASIVIPTIVLQPANA